MNPDLQLYCTLLPSMSYFGRFAKDPRIQGVRLNTPMLSEAELQTEFDLLSTGPAPPETFFDVKGRQLRVLEAIDCGDHLEIIINHPIAAQPDSLVLFKAGNDGALLDRVVDGTRLVFLGGPQHLVRSGESLHVVDSSFVLQGEQFNDWEKKRIEMAKAAGISRWCLSYTESMRDVDEFLELVGDNAEVWLKIENERGLGFVEQEFSKRDNLTLVAARGDLFVELKPEHRILRALQLIISKDPHAVAGSRILLSTVNEPGPSCADLSELAWLREIGYKRYMLCDDLCLLEDKLALAVNVFAAVADDYTPVASNSTVQLSLRERLLGSRKTTSRH